MSRLPKHDIKDLSELNQFFSDLHQLGLLFHPEDKPEDIIDGNGDAIFTEDECIELNKILDEMFSKFGEAVNDAVYPVFKNAMGFEEA